jgi:hypothetical protein
MATKPVRSASLEGQVCRGNVLRLVRAVLVLAACSPVAAGATTVYNSIPVPLPGNVPSLGYQAEHTAEFGDLIQFASTGMVLNSVTVVMVDGAFAADYPSFPGSSGPTWNYPLTVNLYNVDNSGPNPEPGTLIATRTQTFAIPWRPPGDTTGGPAFTVTFDFTGTTVPDQIIYGVAYNTETFGTNPTGVVGPYISLNFGIAEVPPSTGSNPFPDTAYWNTSVASNYADGGAAGVGIFRRDTAWAPDSGAVLFDAVSVGQVPTLSGLALSLLAIGLALMALARLRS